MDKGKRKVSYDVVHVDVIDEEDFSCGKEEHRGVQT
jgi:hypothetical protein